MKYLLFYLLVVNYLAFALFAYDKEKAQKKGRRVPEKNLLLLSFIGGTFGAWIAMNKLRHKTAKSSFKMQFYAIVVVQLLLLVFVFRR
ncbi:DUF1294 domain-containing protein [Flavobacterium sp. JP2137]|uniref:DUF1294 domain-containing protein n=1 Tax=Flavobacterium sp. JP2137 TaxID=3414510 RepID=UPI003D2FAA91